MLYKYNADRLRYDRITSIQYFIFLILPILVTTISIYWYAYNRGINKNIDLLTNDEKVLLIESIDPFSEKKLENMMKDLKIKFPYIPYAQSKLETGNWKAPVFLENHNLFGMKESTRRVSTAKGSNRGHAYYDIWRESVYDYAFYQCRYLGNITTEDEYFQYLSAAYAEDSLYVDKLKRIIHNENLRERFK
jgi:hypothetical protein